MDITAQESVESVIRVDSTYLAQRSVRKFYFVGTHALQIIRVQASVLLVQKTVLMSVHKTSVVLLASKYVCCVLVHANGNVSTSSVQGNVVNPVIEKGVTCRAQKH